MAVVIVSRSMIRQMPVPSLSVFVLIAAAVSATKGSREREYSGGNSPPPGKGVRREVGMCVCSGNHRDSKPRASTSAPSSSGRIESLVGNMKMPMSMTAECRRLRHRTQRSEFRSSSEAPRVDSRTVTKRLTFGPIQGAAELEAQACNEALA